MEREEARRGGLSLSTSTRPGVEVERQSFFFSLLETRFSPLTEKAQPRSRKSTCTKLKVKTVNLYKRSGKGNRLEKAFPLESSCPPFVLLFFQELFFFFALSLLSPSFEKKREKKKLSF